MSRVYIEYVFNCFEDSDLKEITRIFEESNIETAFHEKCSYITNAALDELVAAVLLVLKSDELQNAISILNLVNPTVSVVKWMQKKFEGKKVSKITSNKVEEKIPNIIIQVANTKILLPHNISDDKFKKYLHIALSESKRINQSGLKSDIVIKENKDVVNVYLVEEFAKMKLNMNHKVLCSIPIKRIRKNNKSRR